MICTSWLRHNSCIMAIVSTMLPAVARAQSVEDLRAMSLEDLAAVEVTSVSKRAEPLSAAAAAVYVISAEDIRRSGARTLPEALRLAPNLQVEQIDARSWSITARGFGSQNNANKLLVLIDGRSVYTTLASSVFWELQNPLLDDIDRIEVVSGPGGTLYGPNAVNGVINVITKRAQDSQGGLAIASGGTIERSAGLRYGVKLGEQGGVRAYATLFERGPTEQADGSKSVDKWKGYQVGFRADIGDAADTVTLQGDLFYNDYQNILGIDGGNKGRNLLARWTHQTGDNSSLQVQAYYDRFDRSYVLVRDLLETFDLQIQESFTAGPHTVVIGGGARRTRDRFINNLNIFRLDPPSRRLGIGNAFVQDRIALRPDLALTIGTKVEQTSFTGFELLPNVRLAYQPNPRQLVWGAVSRAVREPSRIDRELVATGILAPGDEFATEKLTAFEAGYRGQLSNRLTLSVSTYYNLYDDIRATEFSTGNTLPFRLKNGLAGHTYGVEAWSTYQALGWWRLSAGVNAMHRKFHPKPGHVDVTNGGSLGNDPDLQLFVRSQINPADGVDLNLAFRRVSALPNPKVPGYAELDARIAWRIARNVELSVAGLNLLHDRHRENADSTPPAEVRRSLQFGGRLSF